MAAVNNPISWAETDAPFPVENICVEENAPAFDPPFRSVELEYRIVDLRESKARSWRGKLDVTAKISLGGEKCESRAFRAKS